MALDVDFSPAYPGYLSDLIRNILYNISQSARCTLIDAGIFRIHDKAYFLRLVRYLYRQILREI